MKVYLQNIKVYHYTTLSNWKKIKDIGMFPYEIHDKSITKFYGNRSLLGMFFFKNKQVGVNHSLMVVHQMQKGDTKILLLEASIPYGDLLEAPDGGLIDVSGTFSIGDLSSSLEQWVISTRPIPPEKIKVIGYYNTVNLLR